MREAVSQLDPGVLEPYLEASIEGFRGPVTIEKFAGGQSNPTFKLTTPGGAYVLRRQPPGELLKSAHAVDREYRVLRALEGSAVPVPKALHLCEDRGVIGSMFYVMQYCDGRIFWNAALPELGRDERRAVYAEMIRILAELHQVDYEGAGLGDDAHLIIVAVEGIGQADQVLGQRMRLQPLGTRRQDVGVEG